MVEQNEEITSFTKKPTMTDYSTALFRKGVSETEDVTCFTIDDVLTPEECQELIELTEEIGYKSATINIGGGKEAILPSYRKSDNCITTNKEWAGRLWACVKDIVRVEIDGCIPAGIHEKLEFIRYTEGDFYNQHLDKTIIRPSGKEMSMMTFYLYLNDDFQAGALSLVNPQDDVIGIECRPQTGRLLLYEQKLHTKDNVVRSGLKYILRADIMFKRRSSKDKNCTIM